ncbi:hypothetical protein TorRG33x02_246010 [Trema orientale]|uniref:Uncharacterized protein n=1 Tax=Trema orientale TaxID=63057 RepID=A0A2P5DNG1_TREOI|nr:hypothetical protein TorRG33x02_246010 [Trema orientale]
MVPSDPYNRSSNKGLRNKNYDTSFHVYESSTMDSEAQDEFDEEEVHKAAVNEDHCEELHDLFSIPGENEDGGKSEREQN